MIGHTHEHAPEQAVRPLLLLDIDGVLCPMGVNHPEPLVELAWDDRIATFSPLTPARLQRLSSVFELVWATHWEAKANTELGPHLGLPFLPVITFPEDAPLGTSAKLPAVQRYVGSRPVAWLDDEVGVDMEMWASNRPFPTLILATDPRIGLTDDHVKQLLHFCHHHTRRDEGIGFHGGIPPC